MPMVRINDTMGVNLDLVTRWQWEAVAQPLPEPEATLTDGEGAPTGTTAPFSTRRSTRRSAVGEPDASATDTEGNVAVGFQPGAPPVPGGTAENVGAPTGEPQPDTTPEDKLRLPAGEAAALGVGAMAEPPSKIHFTVWFMGGESLTFEGDEALRLRRHFNRFGALA